MGKFAENLNLGNRFRPPPCSKYSIVYCPQWQKGITVSYTPFVVGAAV